MPHVLSVLQGVQKAVFVTEKCEATGEPVRRFDHFEQVTPGQMTPAEYDAFVKDTVSFFSTMRRKPVKAERQSLGIWVLLFVAVFTLFAAMLKKEIWKDVHLGQYRISDSGWWSPLRDLGQARFRA